MSMFDADLLLYTLLFPGGYAVGASSGRGLGDATQWLYEREGIPAVPSL